MALEIFKLVGSIFIDNDKANESMAKTDEKAQSVASTLGKGIGTAAKWGTAIIGGATAAAGAIMGVAKDTSAAADEVDKMSQRLGLTRESYQELDFVLSQSGVEINSFSTGMKTLLANMDKVTEGNKTSIENFEKLGISVQNSDGSLRNQEEVLFETVAAFQAMENSAEKSRLAQELFGKQGQEILPLLNSESGSLEAMREQAHELGLIMSDETIDAGVDLTDTLDQLQRSFKAVGNGIGSAVLPLVQQFANALLDYMPQIQAMINQLVPFFSELLEKMLPILLNLLETLLPPLMEIVEAIMPALMTVLDALMPILDVLIQLLAPILELFAALITPIVKLISDALTPLINIIAELMKDQLGPLQGVIKAVSDVLVKVLGGAINQIMPIVENITNVFQGVIDFITGVFTGDWEKAWEGVTKIFSNIFEGIVAYAKLPLNTIITAINAVFSKIGSIKVPDWVPGIGGASFSLPQIPMLAEGGDVTKAGTVLVGERGPEFLDLPAGARVTPLDKSTGIDYDKMTESFVKALSIMLPDLQNVTRVVPDADGIFKLVQSEAKIFKNTTGYEAFA